MHPWSANNRADRGGRGDRGGWGNRGSRGFRSTFFQAQGSYRTPDPVLYPVGNLITTIKVADLERDEDDAPKITDAKCIASYNWVEGKPSAILVPGAPRKWTPPPSCPPLPRDDPSGTYYKDLNAARWPRFPLEPTVRAILHCSDPSPTDTNTAYTTAPSTPTIAGLSIADPSPSNPSALLTTDTLSPAAKSPLSALSILSDSHALLSLLLTSLSKPKTFHLKAELIGATLFLVRQEAGGPKAVIEDIRGYGHTFPAAYTTWEDRETVVGVGGSVGHWRVVRYRFGGMSVGVGGEGDGWVDFGDEVEEGKDGEEEGKDGEEEGKDGEEEGKDGEEEGKEEKKDGEEEKKDGEEEEKDVEEEGKNGEEEGKDGEEEDVGTGRERVKVDQEEVAHKAAGKLTIEKTHGPGVPQSKIFDLKTRSVRTEFTMDEVLPRLWLTRTPNFILAQHQRGVFLSEDISVRNVEAEVEAWEREHGGELKVFRGVLRKLMDVVSGLGEGTGGGGRKVVGVWRVGDGELQVRELPEGEKGWSALPRGLKGRWVGVEVKDDGEEEVEGENGGTAREASEGSEGEGKGGDDSDEDILKF